MTRSPDDRPRYRWHPITWIALWLMVGSLVLVNLPPILLGRISTYRNEHVFGWPFPYGEGPISIHFANNLKISAKVSIDDVDALIANGASIALICGCTIYLVDSSRRRHGNLKLRQFRLRSVILLFVTAAVFTTVINGAQYKTPSALSYFVDYWFHDRFPKVLVLSMDKLKWWQYPAFAFIAFGLTCTVFTLVRVVGFMGCTLLQIIRRTHGLNKP